MIQQIHSKVYNQERWKYGYTKTDIQLFTAVLLWKNYSQKMEKYPNVHQPITKQNVSIAIWMENLSSQSE